MADSPPIRFELRRGVVTAAPLAVAVGLFGVSFGVLAVTTAGFAAPAAVLMSMTTFAGSAQFAAASVMAAGGQTTAAIAAALLLNARYVPIGVSVARYLSGNSAVRFLKGQLVVDESWAIAARGDGSFNPGRLLGAGLLLWIAWVGGTVVGVLGGEALGNPAVLGLDAAFPALFLALLVGQLRSRRATTAAVLGAAIALSLVGFTPPGVPIVAAAAAALIGLVRR
ncbi:MAG TPA: AzlC family ABC transporter permease [Candidatus Limnocylindrales bacterium]|nr:AzlC family ABC transporter permease [Candidatus Limnocylindrales bacterium]